VVAPKGVPAEIITRMNAAIGEFLKGGDIQKRLADFGLATSGAGTPQSTADYITSEQARWRALAKELDIQPQ
jgi:tripartite-type tricarboxylate transporter receptor subunit TctC